MYTLSNSCTQACKATVEERNQSYYAKLKYHYPSILEPSEELPPNLSKIYVTYGGRQEKKKNLSVSVLFVGDGSGSSKHQQYEAVVEVSVEALPEDLIEVALGKMKQFSKIHFNVPPHECVLKVIGREEYLVDRKPVSQYKVCSDVCVYTYSEFSLIRHRFIRQTLLSAINFVHEL